MDNTHWSCFSYHFISKDICFETKMSNENKMANSFSTCMSGVYKTTFISLRVIKPIQFSSETYYLNPPVRVVVIFILTLFSTV